MSRNILHIYINVPPSQTFRSFKYILTFKNSASFLQYIIQCIGKFLLQRATCFSGCNKWYLFSVKMQCVYFEVDTTLYCSMLQGVNVLSNPSKNQQISVAPRSNAYNVFDSLNAGSNPTRGTGICPSSVTCAPIGFRMGRSPFQGIPPNVIYTF
jgi:hypothetical protein